MSRIEVDYVSEHTKFINDALQQNPAWRADQQKGRAIWWDKPQDVTQNASFEQAKVTQKSYPYDVLFD